MPQNLGLYNNDLSVPRKKDIDALTLRVDTNEDNIAMAESDIEGLQTDVGALKTDVGQVKTALNSKQDAITGGASTITDDNLTVNRALVSNGSGKVAVSAVTSTELGYLDGVTSNVQTQLDGKVNKSGDTMTGQLTVGSASLQTNGYVTGTWFKITANTALSSTPPKIAVINDGWIYSRTPAQIKDDIGLSNVDNVKQYSASNPPPYPVTSVNGQTGDVTVTVDIPNNLVKYDAVTPVETVDKLNADTLEGHNAAYFATAAGLSTTNTQVATNTNNISTLTSDVSTANNNISALQTAITNKLDKSGGTMTGALVAQNNADYTTAQVRNVIISTADPSGGSNGMLWIKYTP